MKHPDYDGSSEPAKCDRCARLHAIAEAHSRLTGLMCQFTPDRTPKKAPADDRQTWLFERPA